MARTRIKVCGIRDHRAALSAANAGADALGFVFHPASPRCIDPEDAWDIIGELPPFITSVGLVVNLPVKRFREIEELCPTDLTQLHGTESEDTVRSCGPGVIKAVKFNADTIARDLARWEALDEVASILIDGSDGGKGTTFDWSALRTVLDTRPPNAKPIIIAGGLTPANVADAIRAVRPWAVDVSSGVESSLGVKDPALIEAFCAAVRSAD